MDNFQKFSEPSLPPQKEFYSSLTDEDITNEDYNHAQKVWKSFDMKTMRDYHDLYLKVDVLLLADIMERFREICMENYRINLEYNGSCEFTSDLELKGSCEFTSDLEEPEKVSVEEKGMELYIPPAIAEAEGVIGLARDRIVQKASEGNCCIS
ncbi:RNA-directed DNA polymerase from mobile element jockey [Paramuricea clavata]|uniref:RNA-directed DNA polymerase from mobile element jockey n=1 Tax=Paramuricea clavata TaxID=317549 RepID=A0A7D9HTM4_PARCT|nr:RNA-directed DNA polymerase from mobile element jockey [Paramuricea clavata]